MSSNTNPTPATPAKEESSPTPASGAPASAGADKKNPAPSTPATEKTSPETKSNDSTKSDTPTQSEKTHQERENERIANDEKKDNENKSKLSAAEQKNAELEKELDGYRQAKKKENDDYIKRSTPIADKMALEYEAKGEPMLAKTIRVSASDISRKEMFDGFVRVFKDGKAKDERISDLESKNSNKTEIKAEASAKKNTKTASKQISEQTTEEFIDSLLGTNTNTAPVNSSNSSKETSGDKKDMSNQKEITPKQLNEPIKDADENADLSKAGQTKTQAYEKAYFDAVTANCSDEARKSTIQKHMESKAMFPGSLANIHPAIFARLMSIHTGKEINPKYA